MNPQIPVSFDPTQDIFEIGLMAAASPEFAEALVRAMLSTDDRTESQACACPADRAAAG
jgi:hypothetical protein